MTDDLSVDDSTHAIFHLLWLLNTILHILGISVWMLWWHRLYPDVTDFDFTSVLAFAEPSFAFVVVPNTGAIDITCIGIEGWSFVLYLWLHLSLGHDLHLLFFPMDKGLFDFGLQGYANVLLGIEHIHGDAILEVKADNIVENVKTFLHGCILQRVAGELSQLVITEVIDEILLCAS